MNKSEKIIIILFILCIICIIFRNCENRDTFSNTQKHNYNKFITYKSKMECLKIKNVLRLVGDCVDKNEEVCELLYPIGYRPSKNSSKEYPSSDITEAVTKAPTTVAPTKAPTESRTPQAPTSESSQAPTESATSQAPTSESSQAPTESSQTPTENNNLSCPETGITDYGYLCINNIKARCVNGKPQKGTSDMTCQKPDTDTGGTTCINSKDDTYVSSTNKPKEKFLNYLMDGIMLIFLAVLEGMHFQDNDVGKPNDKTCNLGGYNFM